MAKWIHFERAHDHRWASGYVSAFSADSTVYVRDEVADLAIDAGAAKATTRPKDGEEVEHGETERGGE